MSNYNNLIDDNGNVNEVGVAGKGLLWGILIIIVVALLGGGWWFLDNRAAVAVAPLQAQRERVELTVNGANQLQSQQYFHSKYNEAVSLGQQIKQSQQSLDDFVKNTPKPYNYSDSQLHASLIQTLQGQKSGLQSVVSEYNATSDSEQKGPYRDSKLPSKLDPANPPTQVIN